MSRMEKYLLLGSIFLSHFILARKIMASRDDIIAKLNANQAVSLSKIATVSAGVDVLIAQGGGSGQADLDAIDAAADSNNTALQAALDAVVAKVPGGGI